MNVLDWVQNLIHVAIYEPDVGILFNVFGRNQANPFRSEQHLSTICTTFPETYPHFEAPRILTDPDSKPACRIIFTKLLPKPR